MSHPANRTLLALAAMLILHAPLSRADEKIYKYRTSEGGTVYSQASSGPGELEAVIQVPSTPKAASQRIAKRELAEDKAEAARLEAERLSQQTSDNRIQAASQALTAAETALRTGLEPLPGERLATVNGNSRLTDAYWSRVRALQLSVDLARDRLQQLSGQTAAR